MARHDTPSTRKNLIIFLFGMGLIVTTALYVDVRTESRLLVDRIKQLEESQILLMVPDAQAEAIASWLAENPEQAQSLLKKAKLGEQISVAMGPGVDRVEDPQLKLANEAPLLLRKNPSHVRQNERQIQVATRIPDGNADTKVKRDAAPKLVPQIVAEGKDGVKVIKLPHGGIRVTTRDEK